MVDETPAPLLAASDKANEHGQDQAMPVLDSGVSVPAPVPPDGGLGESRISPDLKDDKFRKARIIKYFPQSNYGFVRDLTGREIYFHLDELRFSGPKSGRGYVVEGAEVGIDVSITSRGMRVTRLKIY